MGGIGGRGGIGGIPNTGLGCITERKTLTEMLAKIRLLCCKMGLKLLLE